MDFFTQDRDFNLISYISTFNSYDLERLKACFEYEFDICSDDDKSDVGHILSAINDELAKRSMDNKNIS